MTLHSKLQRLRHAPGFRSMNMLWNVVRGPYQRLLDPMQRGVKVVVGGECVIRLPAQYTNQMWESFEPATVRRFVAWMKTHPESVLLDIGSAQGIYGAIALTVASKAEVISFESSLQSLRVCKVFCNLAGGEGRARYVNCFISDHHDSSVGLVEASRSTMEQIEISHELPSPQSQEFVCLGDDRYSDIPVYSIDGLVSGEVDLGEHILIKCDIEGAELLALRGAEQFLKRSRPEICLSVHAVEAADGGDHPGAISKFLESLGYDIEEFDVDHERHWWCKPS